MQKFDFSLHISGATIPHIYFSDYGNDYVSVPNLDEQIQIGSIFNNLDYFITFHQRFCFIL